MAATIHSRSGSARERARATAVDLLQETGVAGFTVDAVAKRSGVAKTTIYRHWASGNALLIDALSCLVEPFATPNTGSFRDDLGTLYSVLAAATDDPGRRRIMFELLAASAVDDDLRELLDELRRERTGPIRTLVELAQARGEIPADLDIDLALDLIEGPMIHRFVFRGVTVQPDEVDELLDRVVAGLAAH
jgi:AcrR family transcriptional regulator